MSNCDCPGCRERRAEKPRCCDYCGSDAVVHFVPSRGPQRLTRDAYVALCAECGSGQRATVGEFLGLEEEIRARKR